jgi:hypothetical protein
VAGAAQADSVAAPIKISANGFMVGSSDRGVGDASGSGASTVRKDYRSWYFCQKL